MINVIETEDDDRATTAAERLHIGVVSGGDEVLWVGVAPTHRALAREVVGFLHPRCVYQLEETDARQFQRLLAQGQDERAVDLYFATIDDHWEVERFSVVTRTLDPPGSAGAAEIDGPF